MKFYTFILFLFFISIESLCAQDALARLKYEDAEDAYSKGAYSLAIEKLDEVESILKSSNQKTEYLKILCYYELFKTDYSVIRLLKSKSKLFLEKYSNNSEIYQKYKDVYKITEEIKSFSDSDESIENERQKKLTIQKQIESDIEKINKIIRFGKKWLDQIPGNFSPGINLKEFELKFTLPDFNPISYPANEFFSTTFTYYSKPANLTFDITTGVRSLTTDVNQIVISYVYSLLGDKDKVTEHTVFFEKIYDEISNQIDIDFWERSMKKFNLTKSEYLTVAIPKSYQDLSPLYYIAFELSIKGKKSCLLVHLFTEKKLLNFFSKDLLKH
jgi:hypothetical protein